MKTIEINASVREALGKKDTKRLRRESQIPCVMYGGEKVIHFSAHENEFKNLIYTPNVYLVKLKLGDDNYTALLKDSQFHPVTDKILHLDFLQLEDGAKVDIRVPVRLNGLAAGVQAGGKLNLHIRRVRVYADVENLPDFVELDVTDLGLGKTVKIGELNFDGIELLDPKNSVLCSVKLTRAARGLAEDGEEEGEEGEAAAPAAPAEE